MNWGKGIIIAMGLFITFIVVLVVNLMSKNVDLVKEDYYQKEVDYQQEIDATANANQSEFKIKILTQEKHLVIQLPDSVKIDTVFCYFRRPDNDQLDQSFEITNTKNFLIDKQKLAKGEYTVELNYRVAQKSYLQKIKIYNK